MADDKTAMAEPVRATSRWYVLAVLTAIMTVHHIDRNVISVVVEPIRLEFGLSDGAMGLLTGFAHSATLALFILPMGWVADRVNRVRMIAALVLVWSCLTGLGAVANSYVALLLMRCGVGAAEAGGPPAAISVLSDVFPKHERPTAMGIYYVHVALGVGLIFLGGGWIAQHFGWRAAFLLAGGPGIGLGLLLLFTVREPVRDRSAAGAAPGVREMAAALVGNRPLQLILLAGASATIAQTSVWAWMAAFFMRAHGMSLIDVGLLVAMSAGVAKGLGSALSGPLTRWMSHDRTALMWRLPALMLCLSVPICWAMVLLPGIVLPIASALLLGAALGCWAGPAMVILVAAVQPRMRASSVSAYHLCCNLIGASGGPLLTGLLSDMLGGGTALGTALAIALTVNFLAAACFFAACRRVDR